jgi:hypothetical protein
MRVGDIVVWADAMTGAEERERFRVVELRGERVLVAMAEWGGRIVPTFVYLRAELQVA